MWEWRTIARSPTVIRPPPPLRVRGCRRAPSPWQPSSRADRQEVEGAVENALPEPEVTRADRGNETPVERLRQMEGGMHAVPAEPDCELVRAELASVEEAEQLDTLKVRLQQRAVLALLVLPQVPWVVRL